MRVRRSFPRSSWSSHSRESALGRLTSAQSGDMSFQPSQEALSKKALSGVRIKTVSRGFSEEANSLLDYLVSLTVCLFWP